MAIATGVSDSLAFAETMLALLQQSGVPIEFSSPDDIANDFNDDSEPGFLLGVDAYLRSDYLPYYDDLVQNATQASDSQIKYSYQDRDTDPDTGDGYKVSDALTLTGTNLLGSSPNIQGIALTFSESEKDGSYAEVGSGKADFGLIARPLDTRDISYSRMNLSESFKGSDKSSDYNSSFAESYQYSFLGGLLHSGNRISGSISNLKSTIAVKYSDASALEKYTYDEKTSLTMTGNLQVVSGENDTSGLSGQISSLNVVSVIKVSGVSSVESRYSDIAARNISYDSKEALNFSNIFTHSDLSATEAFAAALFSRNDTLTGTAGDDRINGYDGNDTLTGGKGSDELTGGQGNDLFVFKKGDSLANARDLITDIGAGDRLQLSIKPKAILTRTASNDNAMDAVAAASFSGKNSVVLVNGSSDSALYIDFNGDRVADEVIEITGLVSATLDKGLVVFG